MKKLLTLLTACAAITGMAAPPLAPGFKGSPRSPFARSQRVQTPGIARHSAAPQVLALPGADKAPMRVTSGGSDIIGYMVAGHSGAQHGMYEFTPEGYNLLWSDPLWNSAEWRFSNLQSGWVRQGRLCGFDHWFQYGYFWGQEYYEIDLASGEILVSDTDEDCIETGWFVNAAYDSDTDTIYGYGTDDEENSSTAMFMKTSGANPFAYEIIKDYGRSAAGFNMQCISMCYNNMDKNLYGINLNKDFVRIAKDGTQTVLAHVPVTMGLYVTGLCFSPAENVYYWNCNWDEAGGDWGSALYTIDAATYKFTKIMDYPGGDSFSMLFYRGTQGVPTAPARPDLTATDFPAGSTSGTLTYTMPSTTLAGQTITQDLVWKFTVDGSSPQQGTAAPGAEVKVTVSNLSDGWHTFSMKVKGESISPELSTTLYVGADTPKAPALVVLEKGLVRWSPVTEGINGGYIEPGEVEYTVALNGKKLGTTKRSSLEFEFPDEPVQKWQATVTASYRGLLSAGTVSNTLVAGSPWQLPVSVTASEEGLDLMTIVNANGDDETWEFTDWDHGWYSGQADSGETGDDWIILPAIYFPDADKAYSFYISCMKKANIYPDTWLEVWYGEYPDPAMMTGKIMDRFSPQARDYKTYGQPMFRIPEAGKYYVGIRCITNSNMLGCIVQNIRVACNDLEGSAPQAPADVKATAAAKGELSATVTFTMPTQTISGQAIDAQTDLTAVVSAASEVTATGKPGQAMSVSVPTVQGDNEVTVRVDNGETRGESYTATVFTGVSIPGTVKNMKATVSEDMMTLHMSWDPPTADYLGYVNPETVTYTLHVRNPAPDLSDKINIGTGVTSYDYTLPAGTPQAFYQVGVLAENAAGSCGRGMYLNAHMGTPHGLAYEEDFEDSNFSRGPWINYTEDGCTVNWVFASLEEIATDWAGRKNIALTGYTVPAHTEDHGMLAMPRFSTEGQEFVDIEVEYYAGIQAAGIDILGMIHGMTDPETLHSCEITGIDHPDEFKTAQVKLPASMLNKPWVQLAINTHHGQNRNYAIIDRISVKGSNNALLMVFSADGTITAGKGCMTFSGFSGQKADILTAAGARVASVTLDKDTRSLPLAPGIYIVSLPSRSEKIIVR